MLLAGIGLPVAGSFAQEPAFSAVAELRIESADIEEIVVSAERRPQDLQAVAAVAQRLTPAELRVSGVSSEFRNLDALVPGLSVSNQEGNLEVFIRGVGSTNNTEIGDPAAATYLNGVYIPRPRGLGGALFFDLDRVEVLKGPQGTLRGRNAVGGALSIVPRAPQPREFGGYVEASFGTSGAVIAEGALNLPVTDVLALRVAGYTELRESAFRNAGRSSGLDPAGEERERAVRLSALWEPTERFALQLTADYSWEGGSGFPGANLFRALSSGRRFDDLDPRAVLYRGEQGRVDSDHWGVQSRLTYDFGPLALEYLASYRELDFEQRGAASEGIRFRGLDLDDVQFDNFSNVFSLTQSRSTVQELRFSAPEGARAQWTAGVFYFEERQAAGFFSVTDRGVGFSGTEFTIPDTRSRSLAGYADISYSVTPALRLKAGARLTDEEKSRTGIGGNFALLGGGMTADDPFACCFATRLGTRGFRPRFLSRPSLRTRDRSPAALVRLLLSGVRSGARDTLAKQLAGVVDGSRPNGTCRDTPDLGGDALDCAPGGQFSFLQISAPDAQRGEYEDAFLDGRIGVEFDVGERSLLYASVTTGHKSGGFNDTVANPSFDPSQPRSRLNPRLLQARQFDPEKLIAYEIGSKNRFDWGGRQVTLNGSAFYYDYSDQVFSVLTAIGGRSGDQSGFSQQSVNIADSRILGLELEGDIRLGGGLRLGGNLLWLRTRVSEGVVSDVRATNFGNLGATPDVDLSGNRLPLAPELSAIIRLDQQIELPVGGWLDWQLLGSYKSSYFLSIFNEAPVRFDDDLDGVIDRAETARSQGFEDEQRGFWTVNLGLGYTLPSEKLRFEAFVANLFDATASNKAILAPQLNLRFLNDARTAGIRVRYAF